MATDPRKAVNNVGIAPKRKTYTIDASTITYSETEEGGSAQVGLAVMLSADDTIALTSDAARVEGKLEVVEPDGKATVLYEGEMELPGGDGATLTVGLPIVGALGASSARGYIRVAAAATAAEALVARGRIVNNDTTTAVRVHLGG